MPPRKTILNEIIDRSNEGNHEEVLSLCQEFYQNETGFEMPLESANRLAEFIIDNDTIHILAYLSELIDLAKKSQMK